ncbi:MAG: TetR family transcriptional regulator [Oscillibacter sp.]|nr:TetR family transcriptional regulator [Oscillibacter sp.]
MNRTRRDLDAALRTLLEQKPLNQLRIRELTERCKLRRQSFYYHFKDVYDLFAWSMEQERGLLQERLANCLTWRQALMALLERIEEERAFYQAALDYGGQAELEKMIPLEEAMKAVQIYYRDRCGAPPDQLAEEQERRCGRMVLLSLLESWIWGRTALPPEELADTLERTVERSAAGTVWRILQERGEWNWMP